MSLQVTYVANWLGQELACPTVLAVRVTNVGSTHTHRLQDVGLTWQRHQDFHTIQVFNGSAASCSTVVLLDGENMDVSDSEDPKAPPSNRGHFSNEWEKGRMWFKHHWVNNVMFYR